MPNHFRVVVALILFASGLSADARGQRVAKPNLIVVFTDDHGYADLGCQDVMSDVKTPNIDLLAAGGVRMTEGYVTAPQCVPSRGGLLAGSYQNRFGLESNTQSQQPDGMKGFNDATTLAERLKDAGYATGMAGKWHLGATKEIPQHGFDYFFAKNSNRNGLANFDLGGNATAIAAETTGQYHIDACSRAACAFIDRHHERPFFFYLAYRAPHVPLDAPDRYLKRFPGEMPERRRQALAMLSAVDDGVGEVMQALRRNGIEEQTLVFLVGDNGAPLKIHKLDAPGGGPGWDGSLNDPLNGEKGMLSEGGIRTPFLAYWKSRLPAGVTYHEPVISLDIAATVTALAGIDKAQELDGINLMPYLAGAEVGPPERSLYWRWNGQAAIRRGDWKYLTVGGREWLFNLREDVGEHVNRLQANRELAAELRADWDRWSQQLIPAGLPSEGSQTAHRYFDWYFDGLRETQTPQKDKTTTAGAQRPQPLTDEELFRRRDKDHDQSVTWEEFLNGRSGESVEPLQRRFKARDKNGDGIWQLSEVSRTPGTPKSKPSPVATSDSQTTAAPVADCASQPRADVEDTSVRPNVIMILADDLGWADTTLYGHTSLYQTPNIQALADRGLLFTRAYANSPLCSPTRASLLTGQTPARHGSTAPQHHTPVRRMRAEVSKKKAPAGSKAIQTESVTRLDNSWPTLGKLFCQAGYRTAHFGKWHLGPEPYSPLQHGFQSDSPHHPGPGPAGSYVAPWKFKDFRANHPGEHIEDRMAADAAAWIRQSKDHPFFLNYWQFSVHAPFDAKPELIESYEAKVDPDSRQRCPTYAAMVHSLDDAIGTLVKAVEDAGVAERTVFVFISDNGGNMYSNVDGAVPTSNHPLRGGKATIFEGGIRVPCFVVWPGLTKPASRCDTPIQASDFYPTLSARLGLTIPENHVVDGVDISPLLVGDSIDVRPIFTYFPHSPPVPDWLPPSVAVHNEQWKLIRTFHQGDDQQHAYRLYDLAEDVGEQNDVSQENAELVAKLDRMIERYLTNSNAVVPIPNPDFDPEKYRPDQIGVGKIRQPSKPNAR